MSDFVPSASRDLLRCDAADHAPHEPRATAKFFSAPVPRYRLALLLLALTLLTTVVVGARLQFNFDHNRDLFALGDETLPLFPLAWLWQAPHRLARGLPFALSLLAILLTHELGHYLQCRRYRVRATLPYFLPAPTLIGTFGAFIRITGAIPSRAALFDIGLAGPLAGFALALPILLLGLTLSHPLTTAAGSSETLNYPLIFLLAHRLLHPGAAPQFLLHPVALAAWTGMLATALNLLPGGQLDGGHLLFALAPRAHRFVSAALIVVLLALAWHNWCGWLLWALLLALSGRQRPGILQTGKLGRVRCGLALVALLVLVFCFTAAPIAGDSFLQVVHALRYGQW